MHVRKCALYLGLSQPQTVQDKSNACAVLELLETLLEKIIFESSW